MNTSDKASKTKKEEIVAPRNNETSGSGPSPLRPNYFLDRMVRLLLLLGQALE